MLKKIKPKSEFARNVLTLMTGTTIAQAIPIAISPVLTRLYTPEDFGVFATFIAISTILGSIANGRYELAIMLPKKDEDAVNVAALGLLITFILTFIVFIAIIIFHDRILFQLHNPAIGPWLYFIPLSVFLIGFFNVLNYYNTRKKQYQILRSSTIIKSITAAVVQLIVGFVKSGAGGLIGGQIVSQLFANTKLLRTITNDKTLLSKISKRKILILAKKYKKFPQYSLGAGLLNTLSSQLVNILITLVFSVATLGFYSLVQRVLAMPSGLIGSSIGQVFFQEASEQKIKHGHTFLIVKSTLYKLVILGILMYVPLFIVVESLFTLFFGEKWVVAGSYAKIMIPLFFVQFVVSPLTMNNIVYNKNHVGLIWQTGLFVSNLFIFFLAKYYPMDFTNFLKLFVVVNILNYIFIFIYIFSYVRKSKIDAETSNERTV